MNDYDANITLLRPTINGFTVITVAVGTAFHVTADIEIGASLHQVFSSDNLRVAVRNLTQSTIISTVNANSGIVAGTGPVAATIQVLIAAGWAGAVAGDVLQVIASYTAKAGVLTDYSAMVSPVLVIVS